MAAIASPNGAPQAPVVVAVPAAPVKDPNLLVTLSQSEPIYIATAAILPWILTAATAAGQIGKAALPHGLAISIFFVRCCMSGNAATRKILDNQSALTIAFNAACFSRVLTELVASGLLAANLSNLAGLKKAIAEITIANLAELTITSSDIILGESFYRGAPPVVAPPATRRGRPSPQGLATQEAAVEQGGPEELLFIQCAKPYTLCPADVPSSMGAFCVLKGLLGACLTFNARGDDSSAALELAGILRPHMERRIFGVGAGKVRDALLGSHLKNFLARLTIPDEFQLDKLDPECILEDLVSSLQYLYGEDEDRRAVETSWLLRLTGCAPSTRT